MGTEQKRTFLFTKAFLTKRGGRLFRADVSVKFRISLSLNHKFVLRIIFSYF